MKCYLCTLGSALAFVCVIVGSRLLYLHSCSDSEVFQGKYCAKNALTDCDTIPTGDDWFDFRHWHFRSCADLGHKIEGVMCRDTSQTGNSCFYAASLDDVGCMTHALRGRQPLPMRQHLEKFVCRCLTGYPPRAVEPLGLNFGSIHGRSCSKH